MERKKNLQEYLAKRVWILPERKEDIVEGGWELDKKIRVSGCRSPTPDCDLDSDHLYQSSSSLLYDSTADDLPMWMVDRPELPPGICAR